MEKLDDVAADMEDEPLLDAGEGENDVPDETISLRPKRRIVVEPLLVLYALSGMPLVSLKSQYMYALDE